jgi:hypothetical protein
MLLLSSSILQTQASTQCNSFPKIFGSDLAGTFFNDMDVYEDYIGVAGDTSDRYLFGITAV